MIENVNRQVFDVGRDEPTDVSAETEWASIESRQRIEQGRDFVITPHNRERLDVLKEAFRRGNRVVIVEGPPGTGKSQLLKQLVLELMREIPEVLGYSRTQGAPGLIAADLLAQPRVTPKTSAEELTTQALEGKPDSIEKIIWAYVQFSIGGFLNQLPVDIRKQKIDTFLKKIGVNGFCSDEGALVLNDADQSGFISFLQDKTGKQRYESLVDKKILAAAMELGLLVIIDEASKLHAPGYGLGLEGLENAFTVVPGEVFNFDGLSVLVDSGFGVFMTTNNIEDISPAIARLGRSGHLTMNADSGDMTAAARVLLTNENGESVLADRKKDEAELCRLIWWLEDLNLEGVDVSLNLITPLCKLISEGMSFRFAFQQILNSLKREERDYLLARLRDSFQNTVDEGEENFAAQSLSSLNNLYNADVFSTNNEHLTESGFRAEFNPTTGSCAVRDADGFNVTSRRIKLDGSADSQISSPDGKLLLINSSDGLIVIDTVSMQQIPVVDSSRLRNGLEAVRDNSNSSDILIHKSCWVGHNQLLAVVTKGSSWEVVLLSKVKNRVAKGDSPETYLKIEESRKIDRPNDIQIRGKQLLVDGNTYSFNKDDLLNPLSKVAIR